MTASGTRTVERTVDRIDPVTDLPEPVTLSLDPGDLVMFSLLTPHRSGSNRSTTSRRALFHLLPRSHRGGPGRL